MKQVLITKGQALLSETPAPTIDAKNVKVEVHYSLISTGTEVAGMQQTGKSLVQRVLANPQNIKKVFSLFRNKGMQNTLGVIKSKTQAEMVTGYSCSGRVVEVGNEVRDFKVGDRVACAGAGKANHAEFVSVPRNLVVKVPEECSLEEAASVTLGSIAMQGVRRADLRLGETVAVIGLGLIGQLTVQILEACGCRVVGIDLDPSRVELASSLGMKHGINPSLESVEEKVRHLTAAIGVDAVIITADSRSDAILQQAMTITRKKGVVVVVGSVGLHLQRQPFYKKEIDLRISCSYGPGRYDETYEEKGIDYPLPYVRWTENRNMSSYLELIADKKMDFVALVQGQYELDQVSTAYESLSGEGERPLAVLLAYDKALGKGASKRSASPTVQLSKTVAAGPLKVGLLGCGSFAVEMHLPNLQRLSGDYSIHALCGRDGAKAQTIGKQYGAAYTTTDYREILADQDINLVLISTRHNLHARMALEALQAGKGVFLEKPLATTSEDLASLKEFLLDNQESCKLMVGFNRRFSPAARQARALLAKRVNPLLMVYRVNAGYVPPEHWVHNEEGGGRIIGECCHMLDFFRSLVGREPLSVDVSSITSPQSHISPSDNVVATVKYADGSMGTVIYTSLGNKEAPKESVEIFCDNMILSIDDYRSLTVLGSPSQNQGWSGTVADKGHIAELEAFAAYLRNQQPAPIPLTELIETTELSFRIDCLARSDA